MTLANDHDRVLEGELVLPLEGTVTGLELEVNGRLQRAATVERTRARTAYEEVVRRGVDPALAEWVSDACLRTRVYPIPARGTKRVAVSWDRPLGEGAHVLAVGGLALETLELEVVATTSEAPRLSVPAPLVHEARPGAPATAPRTPTTSASRSRRRSSPRSSSRPPRSRRPTSSRRGSLSRRRSCVPCRAGSSSSTTPRSRARGATSSASGASSPSSSRTRARRASSPSRTRSGPTSPSRAPSSSSGSAPGRTAGRGSRVSTSAGGTGGRTSSSSSGTASRRSGPPTPLADYRRYGIEPPAPKKPREDLILEFYDVSDLLNETPDYPAPELGLPQGNEVERQRQPELAPDFEDRLNSVSVSSVSEPKRAAPRGVGALDGRGPGPESDPESFVRAAATSPHPLRALSNLAEIDPGSPQNLRTNAMQLLAHGRDDLALEVFEEVARLRPEDPRSRRDLALVHSGGVAVLASLVATMWNSRFEGARSVVKRERERLEGKGEADLRIVLTWDADDFDADLHVLEPSGEVASYNHKQTRSGGVLSADLTRGHGPEEYVLERAPPGGYLVRVHGYADARQTLRGGVAVHVTVFEDWGRPTERRRVYTRWLREGKELELSPLVDDQTSANDD